MDAHLLDMPNRPVSSLRRDLAGGRASSRLVLGVALVALGTLTAALTAVADAASVSVRLEGGSISVRPLWLAGFGAAVVSALVGWHAVSSRHPFRWWTVAVYASAALMNVLVAILQPVRHPDAGLVLPVMHVLVAVLVCALLWAGRHQRAVAEPDPPAR